MSDPERGRRDDREEQDQNRDALADEPGTGPADEGRGASLWQRVYHGDTRFDIVGRRRIWFTVTAVLMLISVGSLLTRGLSLGIEFEGGAVWEVEAEDVSESEARDALGAVGLGDATIQTVEGQDGTTRLRVAAEEVDAGTDREVVAQLEELTGHPVDDAQVIGPSWGREITEKARDALIWFLVLVTIYIAIRFQVTSAVPALVALVHDVAVTVGVYSLFQFSVTPATVIAFLTILGYSLYDTVVVFDKVEENRRLVTANGTLTYSAMVNMSLNQTLMRSINTTITSSLPVVSLLVIGSWIMGATTLSDFALALLIGMVAGTYSSFFIASPLLAVLREREKTYGQIRRRVVAQGMDPTAVIDRSAVAAAGAGGRRPVAPAVGGGARGRSAEAGKGDRETTTLPSGRVIAARPRKKKARR